MGETITTKTISDGKKSAEIKLQNNRNFDYIGDVYIGNPPQKIRGNFDTGSANTWILSSHCTSDRCKPGSLNNYFTPEKSTSFVKTDLKKSIRFGSGTLSGFFGYDDFRIYTNPSDESTAIHIKNQILGLMVKESLLDSDYDAIIGLAYPKMAAHGTPVFDSMIQQNLLPKNMFSFYMTTTVLKQSELMFGGYDSTKIQPGETIKWHKVINKLFWSLNLEDILYNGVSMGLCKHQGKQCLITPDSGTSLLAAPSWAHKIIDEKIPSITGC